MFRSSFKFYIVNMLIYEDCSKYSSHISVFFSRWHSSHISVFFSRWHSSHISVFFSRWHSSHNSSHISIPFSRCHSSHISVYSLDGTPHIFVRDIVEGSVVARDGRIQTNDQIIAVCCRNFLNTFTHK